MGAAAAGAAGFGASVGFAAAAGAAGLSWRRLCPARRRIGRRGRLTAGGGQRDRGERAEPGQTAARWDRRRIGGVDELVCRWVAHSLMVDPSAGGLEPGAEQPGRHGPVGPCVTSRLSVNGAGAATTVAGHPTPCSIGGGCPQPRTGSHPDVCPCDSSSNRHRPSVLGAVPSIRRSESAATGVKRDRHSRAGPGLACDPKRGLREWRRGVPERWISVDPATGHRRSRRRVPVRWRHEQSAWAHYLHGAHDCQGLGGLAGRWGLAATLGLGQGLRVGVPGTSTRRAPTHRSACRRRAISSASRHRAVAARAALARHLWDQQRQRDRRQ